MFRRELDPSLKHWNQLYMPEKLFEKHQRLAQDQLKQKQGDNSMHGQYLRRANEKDVDHQMTNQWLKTAGPKSETEGFITDVQDQATKTNCYRSQLLKDGTDSMCKICGQFQENIDDIVAGCPELNKTEYLQQTQQRRYITSLEHLQRAECKPYGNTKEKWYEHDPQALIEKDNIIILWDMPIQTGRKLTTH